MKFLIDPPVGPYSPYEHIERWIEELTSRRDARANDIRDQYDRAIAVARTWLEYAAQPVPGRDYGSDERKA